MLERPLSDFLEDYPGGFPLAELLSDFVNSEVFGSFIEELIRIRIDKTSGHRDSREEAENDLGSWVKSRVRDFGSILIPTAGSMIKNGIARELKDQILGEPSSFRQALEKIIEKYPGITLREYISLGKPKKRRIDNFFAEKALATMDENIEGALSSVNIEVLVSDRINSLDMLRVEKIILDIMANQFKWINFFGAILGALIGFIQIILSLITG